MCLKCKIQSTFILFWQNTWLSIPFSPRYSYLICLLTDDLIYLMSLQILSQILHLATICVFFSRKINWLQNELKILIIISEKIRWATVGGRSNFSLNCRVTTQSKYYEKGTRELKWNLKRVLMSHYHADDRCALWTEAHWVASARAKPTFHILERFCKWYYIKIKVKK